MNNNVKDDGREIICVGLPNTGSFDWRTVASQLSYEIPSNYKLNFNLMANCLVYDAREKLAEYALNIGAKYLLFVDSDMVVPPHAISSMLSHKKDIISGLIFQRKYPFQPCFYTKVRMSKDMVPTMEGPMEPEKWPDKGAYEMEGVGMACCLINMEVFKKIPKPWFYPLPNVGEDLSFCMKARKSGFKIYVDMGVDVGHVAEFIVQKATFQEAYTAWMKDPKNKGKTMFADDDFQNLMMETKKK